MSIGTPSIDNQHFLNNLREAISKDMQEAAEPVIQKALQDIEHSMRKRVGEICIGMVAGQLDIYRDNANLIITIKDHAKL